MLNKSYNIIKKEIVLEVSKKKVSHSSIYIKEQFFASTSK